MSEIKTIGGFRLISQMNNGEDWAKNILISHGFPLALSEKEPSRDFPSEVKNAYNMMTSIVHLREALKTGDPHIIVPATMRFAFTLCDLNKVDVIKQIKTDLAKDAANARHSDTRTLYAMAIECVKLSLDGNCNPEWEHIDYLNYLMSKPKYSSLSRDTLRKKVLALFKERGLTDRISKGRAKHVPH